MEIRINKEIRNYKETMFFGLSARQLLCSAAAVGVAVGFYFAFRKQLHSELLSWACILTAAPIAIMGFFTYQGLTLERFVTAWFKTVILNSGRRISRPTNRYIKERESSRHKNVRLLSRFRKEDNT